MISKLQQNISLSDLTTIKLGGKAKYFLSCRSLEDIVNSLKFAEEKKHPVQVMAGGSNIIFPDKGFEGIVLKIDLKGINYFDQENMVYADVGAGENWDEFVRSCIQKGLTGVECLSGIPGSAGATPIQNVGAYGQEVRDVIVNVKALDRSDMKEIIFSNEDCKFAYRQSRFKNTDGNKYIITNVKFGLKKNADPDIKYPELQKAIDYDESFSVANSANKLEQIRKTVLKLRKGKSMIIDPEDPNSNSCGSFFLNPVLSEEEFKRFKLRINFSIDKIPVYKTGIEYKLSSAWLVEQSGFYKGYKKGGAGISQNHSLALINAGGTTTRKLLQLAKEIKNRVFENFGIQLKEEPVIVKQE